MRKWLVLLAICMGISSVSTAAPAKDPRVLLFSHSTGYRHESIEPGAAAIQALGTREKLTIVHSEDPNVFSADGLKDYDAIIFLSTSTDPKKPESEWFQGPRRDALQAFVHRGGGIVGIHAASDSHYGWGWYQQMIGAHFAKHPPGTPEGTLTVTDKRHRANKGVPPTMRRVDEWYYFDDYDPRSTLLMTLDPRIRRRPRVLHGDGPHAGNLLRPQFPESFSGRPGLGAEAEVRSPRRPASRRGMRRD